MQRVFAFAELLQNRGMGLRMKQMLINVAAFFALVSVGIADDVKEEIVASSEMTVWLGGTEIITASDVVEFALTAFRDLPDNPTAEEVRAAIQAAGMKDENRILALINGADNPVAAYQSFRQWAVARGDHSAVLASGHAGDSFALGAETLFENEPKVYVSSAAMSASGTLEIVVTVKDGETPKAVASEKVADMFEVTSDLKDWTGDARLNPTVTDNTKGVASPVRFTVQPGNSTSGKAFLRLRK